MRTFHVWIGRILCTVFLAISGFSAAEPVCRNYAFEGMGERTTSLKKLVGSDTTNLDEIVLYIGWDKGKPYIQSNYRSADPDKPGSFSEFPTKIRTEEVQDLDTALSNIIHWGRPPPDGHIAVSRAAQSVKIYLDETMIRPNGEVAFDLGPVSSVKLVRNNRLAPSGEIKLLKLKDPPPIATEVIAGCCLRGRPPGKKDIILFKLQQRKFNQADFLFLPLLGSSGTRTVIEERLPTLNAAAQRASNADQSWAARLNQSLQNARGRTLIVMSHMEGNKLAVRSPDGIAFEIPMTTLRDRAKALNVDLILLGCDTAEYIRDATQDIGVEGKLDSIAVAERLEQAIQGSANVAELAERLGRDDIQMIAYDEQGGHGYAGASGFAKIPDTNFFARVFRLLALKQGN